MGSGGVHRLIIGNPENRRVAYIQSALERLEQPPAQVVSYIELLSKQPPLELLPTRIRIESPGENFAVERELIMLGADDWATEHDPPWFRNRRGENLTVDESRRLVFERGRLRLLEQWYIGFHRLLQRLAESVDSKRFVNPPVDIQQMFDKGRCQTMLERAGVAVPSRLEGVTDFESLAAAARRAGFRRVFVKPAHGSSAAGVVAINFLDEGVRATTSVEVEEDGDELKYFNNLQVRTYRDERLIRDLVDFLFRENAHAEQWLPKAKLNGLNFDLRILVVAGRAQQAVVRSSRTPMTNLHLGNERGDLTLLRKTMTESKWSEVESMAEKAAAVFPDCLYVGVDLLLGPGFRRPTVLELNAFGDLLPGVLIAGRDTYETEVHEEMQRLSSG